MPRSVAIATLEVLDAELAQNGLSLRVVPRGASAVLSASRAQQNCVNMTGEGSEASDKRRPWQFAGEAL